MSGPALALVGLTASEPLPGIFTQIDFAQGPQVGSGLTRAILVLANRTTSGSATPDTVIYGPDTPVQLQTESQMIQLGGPGSEAHRLYRRIAAVGGSLGPPVYWLFVAESAGAAATGTITIATPATGPATHRLFVGDEYVDTGIFTGDTVTAIAAAIVANVNSKTHWPVTAANAAGVVTLTSKQKGLRGNWIRFQAQIISPAGIGTTTTATTDAFLTGGTTADSNATALATIVGRWFYQIVSAAEDATQVGALVSQVNTQAGALTGIRQRAFFGSVDTIASTITIAVGINSPRAEVVWSEKSPFTPAELAANQTIVYALEEASELGFRTNFIGYGNDSKSQPFWKVPASRVATAAPSGATLRSALSNGITPLGVNANGSTYIVDRFTTRSLNGAAPELRIREGHKVTICDRFADALNARISQSSAGKVIGDDPPNGAPPQANTETPRTVRMKVFQTIDDFDANSKIQNTVAIKANTNVQRASNPTSRMEIAVPLATADNFRQAAILISQVA